MIVEIHGAGFANKGAELMLRTVVSELGQRFHELTLAIDPSYGDFAQRGKLGLRQIIPMRTHIGTPGFVPRFRKQRLFVSFRGSRMFSLLTGCGLRSYGCVDLGDVEGFIDVSGFACSDQWGPGPTEDLAELTSYFHTRRRPVILLAQAFGPFSSERIRAAFRKVVANADLIVPRDRKSYEYVMEFSPRGENVQQAPDITLFYPRSEKNALRADADYVCIVPNARMLDQGEDDWGGKYEAMLVSIAERVVSRGPQVRLVVHDSSGGDRRIVESIVAKAGLPHATIVDEQDPVVLKQIVGGSLLLIGSRYHSLVAAFSMRVPAVAMGWSHKYEMLFEEFGCERLLISPTTSIDAALQCVGDLLDESVNRSYRLRIGERLQEMYDVNQKMWQRVTEVLTSVREV